MNVKLRDFCLPVIFLVLATIVIALTGADLEISALFHDASGWPTGERFPWKALYDLNRTPAVIVGLAGLSFAVWGFVKPGYRHMIRPGLFLVLALSIGPGLLVNVVFKDYWGRPRPREIREFGGAKQFLHPWQKGIAKQGRSFPSGHAAGAFYLTTPFFVFRRQKPRLARIWLGSGLAFGVIMGIARITQGGHFLSDVLWAWGMVHLSAAVLYYLLGLDRDNPSQVENRAD